MPVGASGGLSSFRRLGTATTNAAVVKASSGLLYGWQVSNVNAAVVFLKFYDKATAPTVGTDTPKLTILVPGATTGGQAPLQLPAGISFSAGISIALTTLVADADTTAVAANEQIVHVFFR